MMTERTGGSLGSLAAVSPALASLAIGACATLATIAACHPAQARRHEPAGAQAHADAHTVAAWVRGAAQRPIEPNARGAALGLQRVRLDAAASSPPSTEPGSCGAQLRSILPLPGQPGVVLLSNLDGELLRYEDGEQRSMHLAPGAPPVGDILAIEAQASPLQLLVTNRDGDELWVLEIGGDQVLTATHLVGGLAVSDRDAFLARYWAGRCTRDASDCLALVDAEQQRFVDRRTRPTAEPETVLDLGRALVADVRYADPSGAWVYLLTSNACEGALARSP